MSSAVFVTGGTGFIGRALVERLVADGRSVRALARSADAALALDELGATPARGDLFDQTSLANAMRGCRVVFHVAGIVAMCPSDPGAMFRLNVDGAENVVRSAARVGARRVVHTSSAATIGERHGTIGREDSLHRGWFLSAYERSKHLGERRALAAGRAAGIEVVSVNPSSVQGPGRTGGTARLILDAANGRLRAMVESALSIVDIADCTEGHILADARGLAGERYLLSGATLTSREALALLSEVSGMNLRTRWLPGWAATAGATAIELGARITRRRPPVCREMVRTLLHGHAYDGSRASRELGLVYTPIEETLRRTLAWYIDRGLIRRPLPGIGRSAPPAG